MFAEHSHTEPQRRYPAHPLVGVGAIILREDRVLLVLRDREPQKGYWSLPGGLLELGERIEDAVRREALEETGLVVEPVALVEVFERILRDAQGRVEYHYVLLDYLCRVTGGQEQAAGDARSLWWARRHELGTCRLTEGTLAVIEKAFRIAASWR